MLTQKINRMFRKTWPRKKTFWEYFFGATFYETFCWFFVWPTLSHRFIIRRKTHTKLEKGDLPRNFYYFSSVYTVLAALHLCYVDITSDIWPFEWRKTPVSRTPSSEFTANKTKQTKKLVVVIILSYGVHDRYWITSGFLVPVPSSDVKHPVKNPSVPKF